MNIAVQAFAEGRQEIAFWPAITSGYMYSQSGAWYFLAGLVILAFAGAPMYVLIRETRKVVSKEQDWQRFKRRQSRDKSSQGEVSQLRQLLDLIFEQFPEGLWAWWYVVGSCILNIIAFFVLLLWVGYIVWSQATIGVVGLGLFALPLIYAAILISQTAWR